MEEQGNADVNGHGGHGHGHGDTDLYSNQDPHHSASAASSSEAGPSRTNGPGPTGGEYDIEERSGASVSLPVPGMAGREASQTPSPTLKAGEGFVRGPSTPGVRISRMMMGMGAGAGAPPPPPGPPPSGPPPLPPGGPSTHPYAHAHAPLPRIPSSRTSSLHAAAPPPSQGQGQGHPFPQARMSMLNVNSRSHIPPPAPPPTTGLPPLPTNQNPIAGPSRSHRRQTSIASSISSTGSGSRSHRRSAISNSINGPPSPSRSQTSISGSGHPSISPRTSSLLSPAQASSAAMSAPNSAFGSPSQDSSASMSSAGHTPSVRYSQARTEATDQSRDDTITHRPAKPPRTPSRRLLQSALDLAQKAVEMDKHNDVQGALAAYTQAVEMLQSVMERVGVEPPRAGRSRDSAKAEEEGRTLRGIHEAYCARIRLLTGYSRGIEDAAEQPIEGDSTDYHDPDQGHYTSTGRSETGGDRTPTRSSIDETAHAGIGNLMLDDDHSALTTPSRDWSHDKPTTPTREHPSPTPPTKDFPRNTNPFIFPTSYTNSSSPRALNLNLPNFPTGENSNRGSLSLQQALDHAAESAKNSPANPPVSLPMVMPTSTSASSLQNQLGLGHPSTSPRSVVAASGSSSSDLTPSKKRELLRAKMAAGDIEFMGSSEYDEGLAGGRSIISTGITASSSTYSTNHSRQTSMVESFSTVGSVPSRRVSTRSQDKSLPSLPDFDIEIQESSPRTLLQPRADGLLVSPSTTSGRIAQRRISRQNQGPGQSGPTSISSMAEIGSPSKLFPSGPSGYSGRSVTTTIGASPPQQSPTLRTRSKSQPGTRPDLFRNVTESPAPPLPAGPPPRNVSAQYPSRNLAVHTNGLAPPQMIASAASPHSISRSISSSLLSPVPEPQPSESSHRPFHLLRIIQASMDPNGPGAYLTGAIHISPHIWQTSIHTRSNSKNQFRILAQDTKVRCMESLIINLEIVRATGVPLLDGPRELKYGAPLTHVPPPRAGEGLGRIADEFAQALDALEDEMDQTHKLMVKAGVAVNGWKGKKSASSSKSWGSRFTRSMDKMTHSKALDSSDKYVELLHQFCSSIQAIDAHLLNFSGPCSPSYHYLNPRIRGAIEARVLKAAEFAAAVVVPFILDDFKQFFSRYLKGGVKYLED